MIDSFVDLRDLAGMRNCINCRYFGGGGADVPAPPEQKPARPVVDEEEQRRLAKQRKSLEAKRRGRNSLVVKPRNPGVASGSTGQADTSGLRVTRS